MIPSGSLACVAYNTIREVENARSKFRQETFETLAKFNLKSFVLFSCCFFLRIDVNPFALSTCTLQTGVAGKNHAGKKNKIFRYGHQCTVHSQNLPTQQHGRYSTFFPPFWPRALFVLASEKCERRSVRQFIELSVRAGLWLAKVPSGFTMAYVAVAQAFAFFSICVSIVAMTEKKGLFVSNA